MEIDMNKEHWEQEACPKYDCRKENCKCGMKKVFLATALGDDSEDSPIAPKNGAYCNAIVVYEANEHVYIYSTEGIPTLVESGGKELEKLIKELEDGLAKEILDRQAADNSLQQEIDDIKNSPDVVDIVATYAALQAYDTSHLGNNDIIRVLADETHDGQSTYYRWNKTTSTWTYIGAVGDYYTKTQVDTLLNAKQNTLTAGDNITINGNVISANGGIFLVRASETTSQSQTPEGSDLQDYAGQTGLYVDDVYSDPTVPGAGNIYYVYDIGVDPETEDPYAEYALIANMQEAWTVIASIGNMMPTGGFGAPDSSTPGQAGQLYIDVQNYVLYVCIDDSNPYVWQQLGGGGGDTVYSTKTTSSGSTGGAVYIGNLDATQTEQVDPTTTDNHNKYFWALPFDNTSKPGGGSVVILGKSDGKSGTVAIGGGSSGAIAYGNNGIAIGLGSKSGQSSVALGGYANAGETGINISNMTAIGNSAQANQSSYAVDIGANTGNSYGVLGSSSANSVTIGKNATISNITNSVALGAYAQATRQGEVNVGLVTGETTGGYNSTAYRVIGGVHDGQGDHDAVTLGQLNGRVKQNAGAPTTSTVGTVGQLLEDTTNGKLYQCTAIDTTDPNNPSYTWTEVGGGDSVYLNGNKSAIYIGDCSTTSTSDITLLNGVTYNSSGSSIAIGVGTGKASIGSTARAESGIAIGNSTITQGYKNIAIGRNSYVNPGVGWTDTYNIAIGDSAYISGTSNDPIKNAIALGANSKPTRTGEVNVGAQYGGAYNNTNYRVIGGVHDGEQAHDAVTVGQVNSVIDAINAALSTNIPHIGV